MASPFDMSRFTSIPYFPGVLGGDQQQQRMPWADIGAAPPPQQAQAQPQQGALSGMGGFKGFLDPQVALPIAAQLMGGRTLGDSLSGAAHAAGPAIGQMKAKQAVNAWLQAGAPKDPNHPAMKALFEASPELAGKYAMQQMVPPEAPTSVQEYQYGLSHPEYVKYQQQMKGNGIDVNIGAGLPSVGLADVGKPDPVAQQKYLASLPPDMAKLVKGIADYQLDISKVTSLRGGEREQIAKLVAGYDPTFDMTQYPTRAAMRKSITSGTYSQALNSANLLIQHADALQKAADELSNYDTPALNSVKNLWNQETGDPRITKFETAKKAVAAEAAKVFKGTGATSEREITEWEDAFSATSSPAQIKASINILISDLLKSRLDTIRSQFESAMGKPAAFTMLTPHSRDVLQGLGLDPAALDNPAADAAGAAPPGAPAAAPGADGWTDLGNGVRIRAKP